MVQNSSGRVVRYQFPLHLRWLASAEQLRAINAAQRIAGLDLLRSFAALGVLFYHFSCAATKLIDPRLPIFEFGFRGVQVFFVISGYVILMTAGRSANRKTFAISRFIRLYPAFLICLLITTLWVAAQHIYIYRLSPIDWLTNLTMFPRLFGAAEADSVYWTLGYEISFYAIVVVLIPDIKKGHALGFSILFLLLTPLLPASVGANATFFVMGIALHEFMAADTIIQRIFGIFVFIFAMIYHLDDPVALLAPLAVAMALFLPTPLRLSKWAGGVSYPLYLVHNYVGVSLVYMLKAFGPIVAVVIVSCLMISLASIINIYLEKPAMRLLKSTLRGKVVKEPTPAGGSVAP